MAEEHTPAARHTLQLELAPLDQLKPHPVNPRRHATAELVHESLDENGQYKAMVVQRSTGFVLAGSGLLARLQERGDSQGWVQWLDVDDATATRIVLVDNPAGEHGGYDFDALSQLLAKAAELGGLRGTGYTTTDLDELAGLAVPLDVDQLADKYGDGKPAADAFYRPLRVSVHPDDETRWQRWTADFDTDHDAFTALLDAAGA